MIVLTNPTDTLLDEINRKEFKQRNVAATYSLALRTIDDVDWVKVNRAIIERWSRSGLERIKKMAWKLRLDAQRTKF